jgi:hyperosmotically inducible protein
VKVITKPQELTMTTKRLSFPKTTIALAGLILGASLVPMISYADDADADRAHPKAFVKDSIITTKIKAALATNHITSLGRIHVDTDADGVVYLSGTARTQDAIDQAVSIAKGTEHVKSVVSDLKIKKDD